jgi:hypothetical protein
LAIIAAFVERLRAELGRFGAGDHHDAKEPAIFSNAARRRD